MPKHLLYEETEGRDDWWYVVADDDTGTITVLHEWGLGAGSEVPKGERSYSVDDFLNSDGPQQVKDRLETYIAGGGHA